MKQSKELQPDDFPWDLRVVAGYLCPVCGAAYTSPGWCRSQVFGKTSNLQPHPRVTLVPDIPQVDEK